VEMIDELLADAKERMAKSVESSRGELATVRTGRASPHLLDRIVVGLVSGARELGRSGVDLKDTSRSAELGGTGRGELI